jgi:hypothetical protein
MFVNQSGGGRRLDRPGQGSASHRQLGRGAGTPDTLLAGNPQPADGAVLDVNVPVVLSWSPGAGVVQYDVYFGSDPNQVDQADTGTAALYRGRQTATTYSPPDELAMGQTCYWRIDDVNEAGRIRKGPVWSFTVASYIVVDGFESYNAATGFYTWLTAHSGATTCGIAPLEATVYVHREHEHRFRGATVALGVQSWSDVHNRSGRTILRPGDVQSARLDRSDVNTLTLVAMQAMPQPLYVGWGY